MSTRHLVDPELLAAAEAFPAMELRVELLPQLRAASATARFPDLVAESIQRQEVRVPGPAGAADVRVLLTAPAVARDLPAVLHLHGGGYVMGAPEMNIERDLLLAQELGCLVASVDYRLAPETQYPGPLEDCYAALRWLHAEAPSLGIDRNRIAVLGASAGGGLAASLALLTRDRAEVSLAYQALIAPMIDDRTCHADPPHAYTGEFVWTRVSNRFGWASLLGCEPGARELSPYAAAARAADLTRLPPAFIGVGALDLFLEEDIEYARRLTRAGVPVELHVYPGAYHGFERLAPTAHVARAMMSQLLTALCMALRSR